MTQTQVVDGEVLDKDVERVGIALRDEAPLATVDMQLMQDMGFIVPIASPEQLRAAFALKQSMFAAILHEDDYLYSVTWTSDGRSQNRVCGTRAAAVALEEKFALLGAATSAKPKKSGIVKLARALGITAKRTKIGGLPDDPAATFAYVEYEAIHGGSGQSEIGVGWCDKTERGGNISVHDIIATADTRAYNRAILRLAGFGDVSADEIIGSGDIDGIVEEPVTPKQKELTPLPPTDEETVVAAASAWARSMADRIRDGKGEAPSSKQDTKPAREMRARSRRGNAEVAMQMGSLGLSWEGHCSDGMGFPLFEAGAPPVTVAQITAVETSAKSTAKPETGWDLSGNGSDQDDVDFPPADSGIPAPAPGSDTITTAQAKIVSKLLKSTFSSVPEMKAWLSDACHVASSIHIRSNQYELIVKTLKSMKEE